MSILIKDMEMPTSCMLCNFCVPEADEANGEMCMVTGKLMPPCNRERLDNCPLVPIPSHGRLIDADELADIFRGFIAMYDSCPFSQLSLPDKSRRDELQSSLAEVINAPTILEAEEGE